LILNAFQKTFRIFSERRVGLKNSKLHKILFERGITQQALAKKTKIPYQYISETINGWRTLKEEQQTKIAEVLGVKREEIFE